MSVLLKNYMTSLGNRVGKEPAKLVREEYGLRGCVQSADKASRVFYFPERAGHTGYRTGSNSRYLNRL